MSKKRTKKSLQETRCLLEKRTRNVLKALYTLSHCTRTNHYTYVSSDVIKVTEEIQNEVDSIKAMFNEGLKKRKTKLLKEKFSLKK